MDRSTLSLLRKQARIKGRAAPLVASLPDEALEFVFDQIRGGASNRGIARALKGRLQLGGSENSIAQSIAKLRKRTLSLVGLSILASQEDAAESFHRADSKVRETPQKTELDTIKRVETAYADLIQSEVAKAKGNGFIPSDLAKHVKALAELSKVRHRLEKSSKESIWPGEKTAEDLELERKSDFVLTHVIGDDKEKYIRGAQKFLDYVATKAEIIDLVFVVFHAHCFR